jgi:hypothetical protein
MPLERFHFFARSFQHIHHGTERILSISNAANATQNVHSLRWVAKTPPLVAQLVRRAKSKDMQNNYEGTVLFWLLPSHAQEDDFSVYIASLQKIINDTRVFFDPDQCIDDLESITDLTIFLVLGPTRSDLLPILHSFEHLRHIYLSEPHQFTENTSQVRGVFPTIIQLLPQLTKDVRMAQYRHPHLTVTSEGDPTQPHRSIADLQTSKADFQWKQALIDIVLDIPTPPAENIHKDLIDEWRIVYQSNTGQTKYINEFEENYDPSNAIYWYTRDTFLYKMVNMALRTENIAVIWRLRFYIQDLYQQLKRLHAEQKQISTGMYDDMNLDRTSS